MRITEPYTLFRRTLKSGKKVYYYQFRDEYNRRTPARSTGQVTHAGALRYCQKLYNEGGFVARKSTLFKTYTKDFFSKENEFYRWKSANNQKITDTTLLSYVKLLNNQLLPYFADMQLDSITTATVKNWIIWTTENWSAKTSNNAQSVLNIILKSAFEKNLIKSIPSANLKFRKTEKTDRNLLTKEEIKKIYNSPLWTLPQQRLGFLLCSITGLRIGEAVALTRNAISSNYINIRHTYSSKFGLGDTKTKINRYVPIPQEMDLKKYCGTEWLLPNLKDDAPISAHSIYMNFRKICKSLDIDYESRHLTIHTLRNFFISYMQSENVPLQKIKAVVGHTDESMTDWYTYWKPEMFPEIYQVQETLYKFITT